MTVPNNNACPMCWQVKRSWRSWAMPHLLMMLVSVAVGMTVGPVRQWMDDNKKHSKSDVGFSDIGAGAGAVGLSAPVPKRSRFDTPPPEIRPAADHPPLKIVAGAWVYTVHYTTRSYFTRNLCEAWTDGNTHQIWLPTDEQFVRDLMMHELMHVAMNMANEDNLRWVGPMSEFESNHDYIDPAAPEMLALLRDNPRLVEWLRARGSGRVSQAESGWR